MRLQSVLSSGQDVWQKLRESKWLSLLLALVAFFVYSNSFPGCFILDDQLIVSANPLVHHPDLLTIFRSDYWYSFDNSGLFRPLTILSLALNRMLFGIDPWGFHLINVLLHCTVTVLIWKVLKCWGMGWGSAGMAALLFAVHPLHTEVVNEAVGRSELLVAVLLLSAFWFSRRTGRIDQFGVVFCYLLALLSKEHAIVFVVLLPLGTAFCEGIVDSLRKNWPTYAGLFGVTILWFVWREYAVINLLPRSLLAEAASPLAFVDVTTRVLTVLRLQGLYLAKLLLPHGLQAVYSTADLPPFIRSLTSPSGMLTAAVTLLFAGLLVAGWRRRNPVALFGSFYLISFLPTSNLLFPIGVSVAERLAYFPSIWFCAGLGVLVADFVAAKQVRTVVYVVLAGYVVWLGGLTLWRNLDFVSQERLWRAEVKDNPNDYLGWQSLAITLTVNGDHDEAERAFQRMLELAPEYPGGLRSLVAYYIDQGRFGEALPLAHKVFAQSQAVNDPVGLAFDGLDLAMIYVAKNENEKALAYLDGPSWIMRDQERARLVRGLALSALGRDAEAVASFSGVTFNSRKFLILKAYSLSLLRLGRLDEARVQLEMALSGSDSADLWNLLGVVCSQQRDWPAAVAAFRQAVELEPDNQRYRDNLLKATKESSALPGINNP